MNIDSWPWLGNLNELLPAHWVGVIGILSAALCGGLIGMEREMKGKAAGLRTIILIAVGSAVYMIVSLLVAGSREAAGGIPSDPGRIAAQVVAGIGFLGAGAILHENGGIVVGLTTAATIWVTAAVGLLVGSGHVAAGIVLTVLILSILRGANRLEVWYKGECEDGIWKIRFDPDQGKGRARVGGVLDDFHVPEERVRFSREGEEGVVTVRNCRAHAAHRRWLGPLSVLPSVKSIEGP
jgi:putative Mg2+ transporter-C (MgtC) family protein